MKRLLIFQLIGIELLLSSCTSYQTIELSCNDFPGTQEDKDLVTINCDEPDKFAVTCTKSTVSYLNGYVKCETGDGKTYEIKDLHYFLEKECKDQHGEHALVDTNSICKCASGYGMADDNCLELDLACQNNFGPGAVGDGESKCYCMNGYTWNETNDRCVSFDIIKKEPLETDINFIGDREEGHNYYVILGSFLDRKEARNFANDIRGRVIETDDFKNFTKGIFAVGYGSFATKTEAQDKLNSIDMDRFKDAYIKDGGTLVISPQEAPIIGFFLELEVGNGSKALQYIVPNMREKGIYTSKGLTSFYSNLEIPLLLSDYKLTDNPNIVEVTYSYMHDATPVCFDTASVYVQEVGKDYWLIEKIIPQNGC